MSIGDELRKAREKQLITVTGAARLSGLARKTIYDIEADAGSSKVETVSKYASALGLTVGIVNLADAEAADD